VATLAASCDGAGRCPAQQAQSCDPYVCGATSCRGDCVLDADCAAGNFCAAGVCSPLLAQGAACGGANQCGSGFCVDGVCCDQACNGQCQACDVPGSAGACVAVAGAPHGARQACASDGSACGGVCDGSNAASCAYPTAQCRGPSCSAGVATLAAVCDGAGRCPAAQMQACGSYVCGPTGCKGNCAADADCIAGDWCSAGVCVPLLADGASCAAATQCGSGNCVDGVCCNSACNGQCEACNVAGSPGACVAVAGDPRGSRPACATDGSTCGGACDGTSRTSCAYPTSQCRTANCANAVVTAAAACDGAGHCPAPQQTSCNAYACGPSACKTGCSADSDCADNGFCVSGACHSRNDPAVWVVAGAGCSQAGPAIWPLLLILAAFALRRRKRAAAVVAIALAVSAGARAQSATFTVDRFQPGAGVFDVLGVSSADTAGHLDWHASVFSSYARDPLRLVAVGHPDEVQLLHGQSMLHFGVSLGLWDRFEVGAVLPLAVAQGSEAAPMLGGPVSAPVASAGFGDLRVLPKARLFSAGGLVLGAALPFTVPIGRQDSFLGAGGPTLAPTLLAELRDVLPVRLLANAGVAVRGGRSLGNLNVSNALTYGLAAEAPFDVKGHHLAALATLAGEAGLAAGGAVERPLELLAALRWTAVPGLDVTAGGGPGLSIGYGTPRYRVFFSLSFSAAMLEAVRPRPVFVTVVPPPPPPRPALEVQPAGEPVVLSRTLALARVEDDHVELLAPVLFERDRDVLLVQSRAVLDATVAVLHDHPDLRLVRVEGHTDAHGNPKYNLWLSRRRAQAVKVYLVRHGIDARRMESEGFGSARPIDSNETAEGRARNRRVELVIVRRSETASAARPGD
jgi:outer membrane protein OmpA-like peptidoglycan-associated protein